MSVVKHSKSHLLLWLLALYFVIRLVNITRLPIFNDEAIYLDWGWREIHVPGRLYYSLYDSKPPLLMWVFGIAESLFTDPLFAGRIVSVLTGAGTLSGIYLIAKTFFTKKIAFLSALFYIFIPIFAFFDRQALMESAVASVGVLACYCALRLWTTNLQKYAYFLGLLLGLGICIKYSAALFIAPYSILSSVLWWKSKQKEVIVKQTGIVFGMIFVIIFLLIINPEFLSGLHKNAQYSLTIPELLRFPIAVWLENAGANIMISFFYLTPFVVIACIAGIALLMKGKKLTHLLFASWLLLCLMFQTLVIRGTSQRYLVAYLPLLVIPATYTFQKIIERQRITGWFLLIGSFVIPVILTGMLLFALPQYIFTMAKINPFSETEYVAGNTSGYGVLEAKNYIESNTENTSAFVGFATNTGNPESALAAYFERSDHITTSYFDARSFGSALNGIDCISMPKKLYFVSRGEQQSGLNRFLQKIKTVNTPYSDYSLGIYTLKEPCHGKSVTINPTEAN